MTIKLLDEQVIAQIAAGEVVERPASVVKELMENAIDAGASTIQVAIMGSGQRLIRISDDGSGIRADEVALAFTRHATSKLNTIDDLERILTLGFRGEALASIAAVSQVTVVTRHIDESGGTRLRIEGGEIIQRQMIGAPAGTILTIENLFYNTPARLKFMKKEVTEKRHIASVVTHYAMAYPHIKFVLEQDGREIFRSSGSGQLADVVVKALGLDTFRKMTGVTLEYESVEVTGFTSMPDLHRSDRTAITLFVNGRAVQDTRLGFAVIQAYHNLMSANHFPISVIMVRVPPEDVDVNVHPTKAEVRFRDPQQVFSVVQRAVRSALLGLENEPPRAHVPPPDWNPVASQYALNLRIDEPGTLPAQRAQSAAADTPFSSDPTAIPSGVGLPAKPRTLPVLRVVGQIGAMYIIAEGPAGMYLIDQHAAHTRVLYDQFSDTLNTGSPIPSQSIDLLTVELAPRNAQLIQTWLPLFAQAGFELDFFGGTTFTLRAIPAALIGQEASQIIHEIADSLAKARSESEAFESIIRTLCRQAAVKAGQVLSTDAMQGLVRQLERCASPLTSPDGQTTLVHMSGEQIAREFRRN